VGWMMANAETPLASIIGDALSATPSVLADMIEGSGQARVFDPGTLSAPTFGFVPMPVPWEYEVLTTVETGDSE
jgi:hypothetical protein